MNKKFSTLVAALLLSMSAGSFTAYAQGSAEYTPAGSTLEAYKSSEAYLVGSAGAYLYVNGEVQKGNFSLSAKALDETANGLAVKRILWEVKVTPSTDGTSPSYVLVNRFTGMALALNKANAISDEAKYTDAKSALGGDLVSWFGSVVSSKPAANNVLYIPYGKDDKVIVMKIHETSGAVYPYIIDAKDLTNSSVTDDLVKLTVDNVTGESYLTANDLNTQFGVNGILKGAVGAEKLTATIDNYFNLNTSVSEGQANVLGTDLQARAVAQWEVTYGEEDKNNVKVGDFAALTDAPSATEFASLYPTSAGTTVVEAKKAQNMNAYSSDATVFSLYSKTKDQYVVVDTAFYAGTLQKENGLVKLTTDKLYNAKNETRYRLPQSYLFKFKYNAKNNTVDIESLGYLKQQKEGANDPRVITTTVNKDFYAANYNAAPVLIGSHYPAKDMAADQATGQKAMTATIITANTTAPDNTVYVNYATLVNTKVLTLSNEASHIAVGLQADYQQKYIPTGAYLLKVTGSNNKAIVGKYLTMSLAGNFQYVEQAKRQNFQNMPAAQWIIETTGSSSYAAPIKITNREFEDVANTGLVYKGGADNRFFFFGGDTLEYTPVADVNNAYLGYKHVTEKETIEAVYTFNFLHELAMDKPINTINEKDSALWVDKDGNMMKFQLTPVVEEDTYGYTPNAKTIAELKRSVYTIRVKDASKLENDKRYLSYDKTSKKYYVSQDEKKASKFFLKENNTLEDGASYYTLVEANLVEAMPIEFKGLSKSDLGVWTATAVTAPAVKNLTTLVVDNDLQGVYAAAEKGDESFVDENGIKSEGYTVQATGDMPKFAVNVAVAGVNYYVYMPVNANYASSKVAVDNNTLALVNGVIDDINNQEVNNSAFAVKKDDSKKYRTIGDAEGEKKNGSNVLNFFRVNATEKEYLYEDANSVYSKGLGMNFLGVEGKGDAKNRAMLVTYTHGDFMPQYLIALDTTKVEGTQVICDVCGKLDCEHSKTTRGYIDGRFLINLNDSIAQGSKFQYGNTYTRLAFVDARLMGDSLIIKSSKYTGNNAQIKPSEAATWAGKDTINLTPNQHNAALFEFRLINDSNDFLMESESWKGTDAFGGNQAPTENGGWVKIQNGVPVIIKTSFDKAYYNAEIFNVELTDKAPVSVEDADAATVSIEGGYATVTVKNAEGEKVVIYNALGAKLVEAIATSDNATFTVSAKGVVMVKAGDASQSVIVK